MKKSFAMLGILAATSAVLSAAFGQIVSSRSSASAFQWTEHRAIVVYDNSMFTAENGVVGGNGTKSDPYVIEGWKIGPFPNITAIQILSTDAYFVIRNVYVFSCGIGVLMNNVRNGSVENSQFVGNVVGVAFYESDNCRVVGSSFEGSSTAISVYYSEVSLSGNTFLNNDINVGRNKHETPPWEFTWLGTIVCAAILVPLVAIVAMLLYIRVKRYPPSVR